MLRDITIGQYYEADSPIHRLDARTKILGTIIYIAAVFTATNAWSLLFIALCLGIVIGLSKVPFKFMVRGLKSILFILIFTAILNLFLETGDVLVRVWKITITWQGLKNALLIMSRLILLILGSSMMTLTATPLMLSEALERLMRPLKWIKVPVHEIAMMISIALRFIPVLLEETDRIMKAQKGRGVDFEEGKFGERVKSLIPIFVPLLLSLFRRADELALAMESRCYRGDDHRTKMRELKFKGADYVALLLCALFLTAVIFGRKLPGAIELIAAYFGVTL